VASQHVIMQVFSGSVAMQELVGKKTAVRVKSKQLARCALFTVTLTVTANRQQRLLVAAGRLLAAAPPPLRSTATARPPARHLGPPCGAMMTGQTTWSAG
jgi:hypothetical protein